MVAVYLDDGVEPYMYFEVSGTGVTPKLYFDRREIILPEVPVGFESTSTF